MSLFYPKIILCHEVIKGEVGFELESLKCCTTISLRLPAFLGKNSSELKTVKQDFSDECIDSELSIETVRGRDSGVELWNWVAGAIDTRIPHIDPAQYYTSPHNSLQMPPHIMPVLYSLSTVVLLN